MSVYVIILIVWVVLLFIGAVFWIESWILRRRRLRDMKPCPECGSKNIRRCINVSEGTEHEQCIDCGHEFPHEGEPTILRICSDDECESYEMKRPTGLSKEE